MLVENCVLCVEKPLKAENSFQEKNDWCFIGWIRTDKVILRQSWQGQIKFMSVVIAFMAKMDEETTATVIY